jgi:hypothetical protein
VYATFIPNAAARAATAPAAQFAAEQQIERPPFPLAAAHQPLPLGQPPRDREHQRPCEVGNRFGEHVGGVGDDDAARPGAGDVDVVASGADVGDHVQAGREVDHRLVDQIGGQADERARAGDAGAQLRSRDRRVAGVDVDVADRP